MVLYVCNRQSNYLQIQRWFTRGVGKGDPFLDVCERIMFIVHQSALRCILFVAHAHWTPVAMILANFFDLQQKHL